LGNIFQFLVEDRNKLNQTAERCFICIPQHYHWRWSRGKLGILFLFSRVVCECGYQKQWDKCRMLW